MLRDELLTGVRLWGVRRVRITPLLAAAAAIGGFTFLWMWNWPVALLAVGGAGFALLGGLSNRGEEEAQTPGEGWAFGGERFAFRSVSEVVDRAPREIARRLSTGRSGRSPHLPPVAPRDRPVSDRGSGRTRG